MARWTVGSRDADERLDAAIAAHLGVSVREARRAIEAGAVRVDDRRAKKGDRVRLGAHIEVLVDLRSGERSFDHSPPPDPSWSLEVVFEDDALIAVNKPAGFASHPLRAHERGTVAHALLARCPSCARASLDEREVGLVHRLDRGTTGVLIFAKRRDVWLTMRDAFANEQIDKTYWALVQGELETTEPITIDQPLRTAAGRARVVQSGGLHAVTRVRRLQAARGLSFIEAKARTGRLHQVRAHLAHIGYPLVGDTRYGAAISEATDAILHARAVSLPHPIDTWRITIAAPLPEERRALIERLLGEALQLTS
jgi:23S rRNA pseudouridine1911/1915/1917 synthase